MAEIVHDIAPSASLYFHDCGNDQIQFNAAITELADAGCQVIVDDIYWLDDPYFEDGAIAQTIDLVVQTRNIVYVTSAGNRASDTTRACSPTRASPLPAGTTSGTAAPVSTSELYVNIPNGAGVVVYLQWDDRFGYSGNNYDLYLGTMDGTTVANSIYAQNGNDNPIESLVYENPGGAQDVCGLGPEDAAAAAATLEVYAIPYSGAAVYTNNVVAADSIHGHKAATGAISVAAARVTSPTVLEAFSSLGPVTIRWPVPEVRQKPDIGGPDGNLITGAGGFGSLEGSGYRFYGTSASCPHIAGLAALVWSGDASATAEPGPLGPVCDRHRPRPGRVRLRVGPRLARRARLRGEPRRRDAHDHIDHAEYGRTGRNCLDHQSDRDPSDSSDSPVTEQASSWSRQRRSPARSHCRRMR